jgi:hypothetical protein
MGDDRGYQQLGGLVGDARQLVAWTETLAARSALLIAHCRA